METFQVHLASFLITKRLDSFLTEHFAGLFSREEIKAAIEAGTVLVNGKPTRPSVKVKSGDTISGSVATHKQTTVEPQKIPLTVLYEDADILVVDKPAGMAVHPGAGNPKGTLANALAGREGPLSDVNGAMRPGIVHRLDKDTSGVILTAKTNIAHRKLQDQFASRSVRKIYHCVVQGRVEFEEGHLDKPIGMDRKVRRKMAVTDLERGKEALTTYRVLERFKTATFLEVKILTGRTHQIRVHMTDLGHPVIGDELYGKRSQGQRLLLHASKIRFTHPKTGKILEFESPIPEDFKKNLEDFRKS